SVTYTNRIASKFQFDFSFTQFTNTVEEKDIVSLHYVNLSIGSIGFSDPKIRILKEGSSV
ncbi:unnamed protein product, partial [Brassica oleracea]